MEASAFSQYAMVALAALVAAALVRGDRRAGGPAWQAYLALLLWLGVACALSLAGALRRFDRVPPPFLLMLGAYWLATTALAFSPLGTRLSRRVELGWLVGFQCFRLPLELLLHRLYLEGVLPVQMTYAGRNFDILTGALAAGLLLWGRYGAPPRWAYWAFNLVGVALLVNIVTIALLSAPTPLRRFMNEPANTIVAEFPFVWLPAFLVQAAWFGHLLVFRRLRGVQTV